MMNRIEAITPILNVSSMERSLQFYVGQLCFENAEWGTEDFTSVSRDSSTILLSRGSQGHPGTWIYIGVDNAREIYEDLSAKGVTILEGPTKKPWALEVNVADPDGHVLRFGSEPEE
jgi:predicted enzyme related to lactoylglutathione lyase|tara:strand:- start:349 stop:699 length:351 start_codon:yes stop_codon:yes gene_type:complete